MHVEHDETQQALLNLHAVLRRNAPRHTHLQCGETVPDYLWATRYQRPSEPVVTRGSHRDGEGDMTYSPDLASRGAQAMAQSRRDRMEACESAMLPPVRAYARSWRAA